MRNYGLLHASCVRRLSFSWMPILYTALNSPACDTLPDALPVEQLARSPKSKIRRKMNTARAIRRFFQTTALYLLEARINRGGNATL
eukprot:1870060-Pyramimonas_sp.AAC.1